MNAVFLRKRQDLLQGISGVPEKYRLENRFTPGITPKFTPKNRRRKSLLRKDLQVAGGGLEPPTHGFSVPFHDEKSPRKTRESEIPSSEWAQNPAHKIAAWLEAFPLADESLKAAIRKAIVDIVGNADEDTIEAAGVASNRTSRLKGKTFLANLTRFLSSLGGSISVNWKCQA
jgi:hypothetical protein